MRRLIALFLGFLLLLLVGCHSPQPGSPQAAFHAIMQAVEDGDADKIDTLLADDFVGETTRDATVALAREWFKRGRGVDVSIGDEDVRDEGEDATIRATVVLSSRSRGGLFPRHMSRWHVETQWKKTPQGWKLRVGQWSRNR